MINSPLLELLLSSPPRCWIVVWQPYFVTFLPMVIVETCSMSCKVILWTYLHNLRVWLSKKKIQQGIVLDPSWPVRFHFGCIICSKQFPIFSYSQNWLKRNNMQNNIEQVCWNAHMPRGQDIVFHVGFTVINHPQVSIFMVKTIPRHGRFIHIGNPRS